MTLKNVPAAAGRNPRLFQAQGPLAGLTHQTASIDPAGAILSLILIDKQHAEHARKEYRRNA